MQLMKTDLGVDAFQTDLTKFAKSSQKTTIPMMGRTQKDVPPDQLTLGTVEDFVF